MKKNYTLRLASFLAFPGFFLLLSVNGSFALEEHKNIKGLFNSTRDVTIKCLECHRDEAEDVLQSTHWTWKRSRTVNGKTISFGKKDSLAGFALDITTNPARCLKCHISNTPQSPDFDQAEAAMIDCLVCHDTTGIYERNKDNKILEQDDFEGIARNVGKPAPGNCMTCHFADCGLTMKSDSPVSENAQHSSFLGDIHMSGKTGSLTCQSCHINSSGHSFPRTMANHSLKASAGKGCASCHTETPHILDQLNKHSAVISCQTCHIPEYARKKPAIISWNWILTGKVDSIFQRTSGGAIRTLDNNGFSSATMIQPVYLWDDGSDQIYTRGQRIRPQELTFLQRPSDRSPSSRISPFRVLYGTQLYDTKYRYLISPLLTSQGKNLFADADWDTTAREGMKALVVPYSGQYGVAPTALYRRINHGVVPVHAALGCVDCHGRSGRINWDTLNYDQDPWTGRQPAVKNGEPLKENENLPVQERFPPVQETEIPSGTIF